jgi:hypothetical protein
MIMEYNGWSNYETWRVHLELFDGSDCAYDSPDDLQWWAQEVIEQTSTEGIARDWALAFIDEVNWKEIYDMLMDSKEPENDE